MGGGAETRCAVIDGLCAVIDGVGMSKLNYRTSLDELGLKPALI